MRLLSRLPLLLCTLLFACGGAPPPAPPQHPAPSSSTEATPAEPVDPEAGRAPTPYTAEQIRAATKPGRAYEYLVERPGELPVRKRMVFVVVGADEATIASQMFDPHGVKAGEPEFTEATWEELRRHASFPREATTIADDRTETPVGTFDCKRYEVLEALPDGERRTTFWFANGLPGAPVEIRVERAGEEVSRMTLLRYDPGE